jgi:hypothetical protein
MWRVDLSVQYLQAFRFPLASGTGLVSRGFDTSDTPTSEASEPRSLDMVGLAYEMNGAMLKQLHS